MIVFWRELLKQVPRGSQMMVYINIYYIENITWLRGNMKFISSVNKISHE